MIKLLRVDDRLLHGQVAFLWTKMLMIEKIIIANNDVANDEFLKMIIKMAKPIGVDLQIIAIKEAIELINRDENTNTNVAIIVNNLKDAKKIINESSSIKSLNLGGLKERPDSKRFSQSVTLTKEDILICKELINKGIEVEIRMTPEEKKIFLNRML